MTAPLTPPGCDLRGLPYFPIDVARLKDSDLWVLSTPEQFKAAFAVWCRSWSEVSAASLPADDAWLARAAGMTLDDWHRVKPMALRGWITCSDGRLYHPLIAERACRAWLDRLVIQERSAKGNASRYGLPFNPDLWTAKRAQAAECLARLDGLAGQAVPVGEGQAPAGNETGSLRSDLASEGEEKGKFKGKGKGRDSLVVSPTASPTPDVQAALALYQSTAVELGLPTVRALTPARADKLSKRLSENGGLDGWREAMDCLRSSPHCQGHNDRGWRADLDFLLSPTTFLRLIEGRYAGTPTAERSEGGSRGYVDLALEGGYQ